MTPDAPVSITLLIPCFNAGSFLPRLIESVRRGSAPFGRILCYDDGSTDDTVAVARSLGLEVIVAQQNGGVAKARNALVAACETEWFHFHDPDDLIGPDFVRVLSARCRDGVDVVGCDADWLDEQTRHVVIKWRYAAAQIESSPAPYLLVRPMSFNNTVIRRSAWLRVGGCDESLAMWEDADLHFRLAESGAVFAHVPEVHSIALRRQTSFSHDYRRSWQIRLGCLQRYAAAPDQIRDALVTALDEAARQLCRFRDYAGCRQAVTLAESLGGALPQSHSTVIRACRKLLGPIPAFRLQALVRPA